MSAIQSSDRSSAGEKALWVTCFLVVLMAHASAAIYFTLHTEEGDTSDSANAPIVYFAALPTLDAPPRQIAPGQEQVQTEAAPPPAEAKPEPLKETEPVTEPTQQKVSEAKLEESQETKPAVDNPVPVEELQRVANADVTLPTEVPPPPASQVAEKAEESDEKSEVQPTPALATASETTAPTSAAAVNAQITSWKRRLTAHLHRHKRYPQQAAARGERGTTELTFSIDRTGAVVSARIAHGSGSASLDEETLAMIRRAQPLPRPPSEAGGQVFTFTVPVRYTPK